MKRYLIRATTDKCVCGSYEHTMVFVNSLESAKSFITGARKQYSDCNARDFKVFDTQADVDEETGFIPCVYEEK